MRFIIFLLMGGTCMYVCNSCSMCSRQQTVEDTITNMADFTVDSAYYVGKARNVFLALPTPIEVSVLIKNSGIAWQPYLLNNPQNASKYLTNRQTALNFGVYVTDLTYAGLFEQSQTMLQYKLAIQQLIERLGLQSAIDPNTLQQLEDNINSKDVAMQIISDTYASCTALLNESDRYSLTLAILTGGWVEGMYIATTSFNENLLLNENRMKQLVVDQILVFDMIWQVMYELKDIPDVANMMNDLSGLAYLFDTINVDNTSNTVTVADDGKTDVIVSHNTINLTPDVFEKIKIQIQILRDNFIKV